MLPPVIFLLGPTASGKTALALHLANRFPLELISVDSALVYRDMNIGAAKPDASTLAQYPHHLINLIDPTEAYSAARFCADALHAIQAIQARGNTPLLVGGTMLYVKALVEGLSAMPPADPVIRHELDLRLKQEGLAALYAELGAVDAITAARLKPADMQRILRALEVFLITGKPISKLQTRAQAPVVAQDEVREERQEQASEQIKIQNQENVAFPFPTLMIGLIPQDRTVLHQRIAARFDLMLEAGLIEEVQALRKQYLLKPDMPSMRAVGYRQTWDFLEGKINEKVWRETGIAATRQLAKRQLTWLRSMRQVETYDCFRPDLAEAVVDRVERFLKH